MTSVTPDPDSVDELEPEPSVSLTDSGLYFNREVSWLDFNDRVLQLAEDTTVPLLERVKFCAIYNSNLDEFFMVRVAGLHDQLDAGIDAARADGMPPGEAVDTIKARVGELGRRQIRCLENELVPGLATPASASPRSTTSPTTSGASSTRASGARSSPCSRRWPSAWGGRSRTSPTSRSRWRCSCATRSPATRPSRA